jgi:hypothetical protein
VWNPIMKWAHRSRLLFGNFQSGHAVQARNDKGCQVFSVFRNTHFPSLNWKTWQHSATVTAMTKT